MGECPIIYLVTGGTGSIGSEVVRQLLKGPPCTVRVLSNDENGLYELWKELGDDTVRYFLGDVRDPARIEMAMRGVDTCIHAAALKHVRVGEYNPAEMVKTNVDGTLNVITACIKAGVKRLVNISTDKAVSPMNAMGASKLLSEKIITAYGEYVTTPIMYSVRFGNVLGSRGSVVDAIHKEKHAMCTDRCATRFLMTIPQAAGLILKTIGVAQSGDTYILQMPKVVVWDLLKVTTEYFGGTLSEVTSGLQHGERLNEMLMTREEADIATRVNGFYLIRPGFKGQGVPYAEIDSGTGDFLSNAQILALLKEVYPE